MILCPLRIGNDCYIYHTVWQPDTLRRGAIKTVGQERDVHAASPEEQSGVAVVEAA